MPGAAAHGGTLSHAAVGFPTRQWDFIQTLRKGIQQCLPTSLAIAFVAVYPMETEAMLYKDTCMDTFIARGGEEEQKTT